MDFTELDRHFAKINDEGATAYKAGKTKYNNAYDPGSLSFDAWALGWENAKKEAVQPVPVKGEEKAEHPISKIDGLIAQYEALIEDNPTMDFKEMALYEIFINDLKSIKNE